MHASEIVLPEAKPALEWIDGRAVQKLSPRRAHSLAQSMFWAALHRWARERRCGFTGTEWEFRLQPPHEVRRPLVPDVAYLSYVRMPRERLEVTDIPRIAPDAVVEVLSPGDRRKDVESKVRTYLSCGTSVIFLVDTKRQTVEARFQGGARIFGRHDIVTHPALPEFEMAASALFDLP